jgi:hypothetical protein
MVFDAFRAHRLHTEPAVGLDLGIAGGSVAIRR